MSHHSTKPLLPKLLITLCLLFALSHAGTITPYGTSFIEASIANKKQYADYTFNFVPSTIIPAGGGLRVIFPSQYDSGLGVGSSTPTCSVPCTVTGYTVEFTFADEVLAGKPANATIQGVLNPSSKGGTGNFQLQTIMGINVIDENLIFDVIGIADDVGTLTSTLVAVDSKGISNAGETTRYTFSFKVSQLIPANSYMKFSILDTSIGMTRFPACNAYAINGKIIQGEFHCETKGRNILVRGLDVDIPATQEVGISVAVINPPYSGITSSFTVALLREGTNVIYDVKSGIPGVKITAGIISSIALTKVDSDAIQSRNKVMDYTLTFQLRNPLAATSVIAFEFPPSFLIDTTAYKKMYVRYGLDDPSESSTVTLSVDSKNVLRITNFVPFTNPQIMSVYLRLINPDNVGESTPVNIRTYLDALQTIMVDEDVTNAYTVIEDITSPASHSITTPSIVGNALQALIEFNVVPTVTIPANGVIKIRIPSQFSIGTLTTGSCMVTSDNAGTYMNADSCYNIGNSIYIVLPNTVSFPLSLNRKFKLVNVITSPVMMDKFLFDIETYLNDGSTLIETWTDYLQVTPSAFSSSLIDTLEKFQGSQTVITGSFTTLFTIPAGITQNKATDLKGFLEFVFTGTASDLGMGITTKTQIPCYANSGLTAITGTINCYLTPGSTPTIRVENFQEVAAGTYVSISIPKVLNPSAVYSITMKSVQLVNRIRTDINSVTTSMPYSSTAATLVDSVTTSTAGYTFTSVEVSQPTSITFNPTISATVTGPGTFLISLPFYDIGWIPTSDAIICKLGATVFPCVRYQGADWITIRLGSGTTYTAGSTITIQNLQVPRYTTSLSGIIVRYLPDSSKQTTIYKVLNNFPTPTVPTFTQATLISNKKNQGAVDVEYTLVFVAPNIIPEGASVVILFPSAYNLLSSSPAVSFSSPNLVPSASASKVSFIPSIQKLIVSGFQTLPALTSFSIVVSGLKNPSGISISQTWQAQVVYNNNYMVYHNDFDKFVFMPALTAGSITFNSIGSFPLNADEEGIYTINFVPASEIPIGGIVQIIFPANNYNDLPSPSYVSVSGGISTFSSCTLSGTTYTLVLDTKYESGGIIVTIQNVRNPDRGTTDGFIVRTYYDGVMLDDTDTTSLTGRTVTLTDGGDRIIVNSMALDPKNEGEQSTYTFSFVTTNTIENTMQIKIIFPPEYDSTLGENIKCATTSGLIGDITCTAADRTVTISGFDAYLPDTERPVIIKVYGVVNPNYNDGAGTSQFKIGTLIADDHSFVDYNSLSGTLDILPAPGWAVLYNVLAENLFTRLQSDYTFNFTGFANIPRTSSEGAILVDFPSEFDIPDGDINCDILTTAFSPVITCSFARNRISIAGQTEDYTGNVGFIVRNIQNPIDQGTSKNIVLKTYDGLNVRIIERSFKNLDPFMFTYSYPGPLITVNNNEPINTIRGTQTEDLYVTVDFPCALNLTLKPYTPGFSVIPFGIDMSLGQTKAKFRVSVPQSFAEGTYEIEWETLGDMVPAYYTPIKKTTVIVTKQTGLKITAPTLNYIPFGGNSLPSTFRVDNGPDIQIQLTINFLITYPGISLSTKTLTFEAGQEEASFIIYSSSDDKVTGGTKVEKGTIVISLMGINSDIYTLSTNSLDFKITDTDLSAPEITALSIYGITQHSAGVSLTSSEVIMIYYMLALAGTDKPPLSEVIAKGPAPYRSTQSRYGVFQVNSSLTADFTMDNLVAETPYVIYLYYIDGGDNVESDNKTFNTLNRYNGVDFSLRFKQYDLNQANKAIIINAVSFTLSLFADKLQERKYVASSSNRRLLSTEIIGRNDTSRALQEEVFVLLNLQLAASPEYSVYPSPKNLATSLNDKTDELTARLPDADPDYKIEAFEFVRYQPSFPSVPVKKSVSSRWAAFSGKLDNYGWIFVACVKVDEDHGVPTPYQILHYLDNRNIEVAGANVEVSAPYTNFVVNATGLTPLTNYTAYIVGGSAHPGYPDPMDPQDIVAIKFITGPPDIMVRLNITGGPILRMAYSILAVIMLAFWALL